MRLRQSAARHPARTGAADHLLSGPALVLAAIVATFIMAPLAVPTALAVGLIWHIYGGRPRWLLAIGLLAVSLAAIATWPPLDAAGLAWGHWSTAHAITDREGLAARLAAGGRFLTGFGPVGPAFGLLVAGCWAAWRSVRAHGQVWHPLEARRQQAGRAWASRRARRLSGRLSRHGSAFGVLVDASGIDRRYWRPRWAWTGWGPARILAPGGRAMAVPFAIFGMPHSGKTTAIERLAWLAGRARIPFYLVDAKATDPTLPARVLAAFRAGWPGARALVWPAMPLDGWRCGDPNELVGRLMAAVPFTREGPAAHYAEQAKALLQLACCAPCGPPGCSAELLERLDSGWLAQAWSAEQATLNRVARLTRESIDQHAAKFETLFHALSGALDGAEPIEAYEVAVLAVPGLSDREAARTVARWLLADLENMAGTSGRHRRGDPALIVVDEYAALGSDVVVNLAQRGRDAGVVVVPAAQALADVGDDREVDRLIASCAGGIVALRSEDGERLARLGGHEMTPDVAWRMESGQTVNDATVRAKRAPKVDPDDFGRLADGEGYLLLGRERAHVQVIRNDIGRELREVAVDLADLADATEGPLHAYVRRMADVADHLAPVIVPPIVAPGRKELPTTRPARTPLRAALRRPAGGIRLGEAVAVLGACVRLVASWLARGAHRGRH